MDFVNKIKESILAQEQAKTNRLMDFWERLKLSIPVPKSALALATALTLILLIGTIQLRNNQFNTSEQVEYLSQLTDVSADLSANDEKGFGTLVEQYFL